MSLVFAKPLAVGFLGPSSSVDNQIMRFDGTTGHLGQAAPLTYIGDDGHVSLGQNGTPCSILELWDNDAHPILSITAAHNTDYDPQIQFRTDATDTVKFSMGVDGADDKFKIFSGSGIGGASEFVIDSNGRIGIGVASPGAKLDIYRDADNANDMLRIENPNSGTTARLLLRMLNDVSSATISYGSSNNSSYPRDLVIANNDANGDIQFYYNGGINIVFDQSGVMIIGAKTYSSNNPKLVIGGTTAITGNTHAFVDEQTVTGSSAAGHDSFDANGTYNGSNNYEHVVGFQSRPSFQGSETIDILMGFTSAIDQQNGIITNAYHYKAKDITGSGTVNNQYGFYVEETLDRATNNWAFYANGITPSYFGGNVGIGESAPETLVELTSTVPYITFHNSTEEDTDGGRESIIWFSGEQSGGEETHLAAIRAQHDGAADDQKGDLIFYTNDGTDDDAPTERMRIDSSGNVGIGTVTPLVSGVHVAKSSASLAVKHPGGKFGKILSGLDAAGFFYDESGWFYFQPTTNLTDTNLNEATTISFNNIGSIGIGDYSPNARLEVVAYGSSDLFHLSSSRDTDGDLFTVDVNGRVGIGVISPGKVIDVVGGGETWATVGIQLSNVSTNNTTKQGRFKTRHYNNSEEPFSMIIAASTVTQGIIFIGGGTSYENSATDILFYTATNNTTTTGSVRMAIDKDGNVGIGETAPETLLELTSTTPYFTFHNSTEEDGDGGRESIIWFSGEQSGGEETHLAAIRAQHDGAADDQKGELIFYTNDGTDGDAPTERMRIDSAGLMIVTGSANVGDGGITNYAAFAADGELTLVGTAKVKQSEWMSAQNFKVPATNPATMIHYGMGWALEFSDEAVNYEHAELRIAVPKDIDTSVQPILIVGWSCPTADPGDDSIQVRWELEYLWRGSDEAMDAAAEATVTDNYTTSQVAKGLVITQIQLANLAATDACLSCELIRRSDNAGDTADGVAVHVAGACLYYTKNKLGEAT